jgi:hypothetical protein
MRFLFFFVFTDYQMLKLVIQVFWFPLDIPMQLSGNFGELRPNHFHAGFDFKHNSARV